MPALSSVVRICGVRRRILDPLDGVPQRQVEVVPDDPLLPTHDAGPATKSGGPAGRLEQTAVVGQLEIVPAPPGLQLGVRFGGSGEDCPELRGDGAGRVVPSLCDERLVVLDIDGQIAAAGCARSEGIGANEEVGLADPECDPIDRQPATDHERDRAVQRIDGGGFPDAWRKVSVDDHGVGDLTFQQLEDAGLDCTRWGHRLEV